MWLKKILQFPSFLPCSRVALCLALAVPASLAHAADVQGVRLYRAPDNTRLVFDLTGAVEHTVTVTAKDANNPERLVIAISNTAISPQLPLPDPKGTPITRISTERVNDFDLRVVLDLGADVIPKSFLLKPNAPYGHRLVIDLTDKEAAKPVAITAPTVPEGQGRDILVVIDAGHGGEDPGASGPRGIHEKDVTLKIARELASVISQQKGYRAHLTRSTDFFIPLQGRSKIAADLKADLFVSIHADAYRDKTAAGASVFAWSRRGATSTTAKFLADSENLSDLMGGTDPQEVDDVVAKVVADLSIDGNVNYSLGMGRDILAQVGKITRLHKHHVEQAGFMVLKSVQVPSLLIETGFISNPKEADKLTSPDYQHELATAIFSGIDQYFMRVPPPGTYVAALKGGAAGKSGSTASTVVNTTTVVNPATTPGIVTSTSPDSPEVKNAEGRRPGSKTTGKHSSRRGKVSVHVVKRGETLSGIAEQYGVSMSAIKKRNKLKNANVWVGQRLKIPEKS